MSQDPRGHRGSAERPINTVEDDEQDLTLETATRDPEAFKTQQVAALAAGKQN